MSRQTEAESERSSPTSSSQFTRHVAITLGVAAVVATVLTAWKPASLDPGELVGELMAALEGSTEEQPAQVEVPEQAGALPIAVVAGHAGPNPESGLDDPGATCPDGLTEAEINAEIARLVEMELEGAGFETLLMDEFDARLDGFRGAALVSVHTDSCAAINELASGYKVTAALDTAVPDRSQRLVACIADRYGRATDLVNHPNSVTLDMTEYHTFFEIDSLTPAAIVEVGFLFLDRDFLTREPDRAARGIVDGLLCFVNNEPAILPLSDPP